jgi:formate dehydrogenase subunit delta
MDAHHLVEMANQIGSFYAAEPDRQQALLDTATHLRRFWDPRMRSTLYQHLDQHGGEGLDAFVTEAVQVHRKMLEPAAPGIATGQ